MTDLLRLARQRRDTLSRELAGLDRFVRMADELLDWAQARTRARAELRASEVDPFQARFNSGEVLPPLPPGGEPPAPDEWVPVDADGVHFVRRQSGEG